MTVVPGSATSGGRRHPVDAPRSVGLAELAALPWRGHTGPYTALGHSFDVRSTDEVVGRYLEGVLAPLGGGPPPRTTYSVVAVGAGDDQGLALYDGTDLLLASNDAVYLVDVLLWTINQRTVRDTQHHLLVHAAAAGNGRRAALFPAPSGSGKTTLVAGLLQRGLQYFTDETVAIDLASMVIHPYPRSLSVKEGSWPVLSTLRPDRPEDLLRFSAGQWHVDPRSIGDGGIAVPAPAAFVVAPRFIAGATTRLEPMSRADAVVMLARSCFNLGGHGAAGLDALAGVARSSACYRLVMGDLGTASALVDDVLHGRAGPV